MIFKKSRLNKFNVFDYIRMYKSGGFKLIYNYFADSHLFDILNGTNTHTRIPINEFPIEIDNMKHSVLYMASWTSVIKESTKIVLDNINTKDIENTTFIDIGCGKGKVLLVWLKYFILSNLYKFKVIGIDFNPDLIKICMKNLQNFNYADCKIITDDITKLEITKYLTQNNILYLYNPFDEVILQNFINIISKSKKKIWIIYNNPVNGRLFLNNNFIMIYEREAWHPNLSFVILENTIK